MLEWIAIFIVALLGLGIASFLIVHEIRIHRE